MSFERTVVELVDAGGNAIGACSVAEAHAPPGRLHRAFSVLLFDAAGRVLLQRRALTKSRFAGRWTNTCCSHPAPGEDLVESAVRRLREELGLEQATLTERGRFTYRAADPGSGCVEYEFDHVLVGTCDAGVEPRPLESEVDSWRWITPERLLADLAAEPQRHSPWLGGVLNVAIG